MKLYKLMEVINKDDMILRRKGELIMLLTPEVEEMEVKEVKPLDYCFEVILHHESYHKRRYRECKEKGLCPKCGRPNDTDRTYCSKCEKTNYVSKGLMFEYREASGRCKTCGEKLGREDKKEKGGYFKHCHICRVHMRNKNTRNLKKRGK